MVKLDTQAGVFGHSVLDLPGRHFLLSPYLALSSWTAILVFIGLTAAGFILAHQARKEFRMRLEEQRQQLETQANDQQAAASTMSRREYKSFTRKSIMVLNSTHQKQASVAGLTTPRNVFDRPCRDSILVAQITPQSDGFSNDDSYYQFSRQVARESFWDPAIRKSIMSVASVSSLMPRFQKRRSVGFAMIEQLGEQAFEVDLPKRQHRPPLDPSLRVKDHHHHVNGQSFVPPLPSRVAHSIAFDDPIDSSDPFPRRTPHQVTSNDTHKSQVPPPPVPELAPPAIISADEALAQYAASRLTTPAPPPPRTNPSRSNSFLRRVRGSLGAQPSPAASSPTSDLLTPRNDGDIAVMQPMNLFYGDSTGPLSDVYVNHADLRLQSFLPTHSSIGEEGEEDYFDSGNLKKHSIPVQPLMVPYPRRLPQAVLNESTMTPSTPSPATHVRPKLKISPAAACTLREGLDSSLSLSNSPSSLSSSCARRTNKIELPASPRDGLPSPGSAATSFSSRMPHSTPPCSSDSREESRPATQDPSAPRPPLPLKRLPSLSGNPYRARKLNASQPSPREEMHMVRLKHRQDHLKRNHSTPSQPLTAKPSNPPPAHLSARSPPIRKAASTQARIPLGGTMSSGGVRDSSFVS